MSRTININVFDRSSIEKAIKELRDYKAFILRKTHELAQRLADDGAVAAMLGYEQAYYRGDKDFDVNVEELGENKFAIVASGETVLILEFGAGVTYGYGHPQAGQFGYGPTTYPGQTHAADPKGWWLPKAAGGGHTFGNAPSMTMYKVGKDLHNRVAEIAREVFNT